MNIIDVLELCKIMTFLISFVIVPLIFYLRIKKLTKLSKKNKSDIFPELFLRVKSAVDRFINDFNLSKDYIPELEDAWVAGLMQALDKLNIWDRNSLVYVDKKISQAITKKLADLFKLGDQDKEKLI